MNIMKILVEFMSRRGGKKDLRAVGLSFRLRFLVAEDTVGSGWHPPEPTRLIDLTTEDQNHMAMYGVLASEARYAVWLLWD